MLRYLVESNEFHRVEVTVDGATHATGIEFAVMPDDTRPIIGDFLAADTLGGKTGIYTNPAGTRTKGVYRVYARVTDAGTELPWLDCGPQIKLV